MSLNHPGQGMGLSERSRPRLRSGRGANIVRWLARMLGALVSLASIVIAMFMTLGVEHSVGQLYLSGVAFAVLPGYVLAWWREGLGGMLLVLLPTVHFFLADDFARSPFISPDMVDMTALIYVFAVIPMFLLALVTGVLFLLVWLLTRRRIPGKPQKSAAETGSPAEQF